MRTSFNSISNLATQGIIISDTNRIMGGKRGFVSTELTTALIGKATYKTLTQIVDGSFDGDFNMRYGGLTYNVTVMDSMMHITGGNATDICIEW
jgi:hypothetical protein